MALGGASSGPGSMDHTSGRPLFTAGSETHGPAIHGARRCAGGILVLITFIVDCLRLCIGVELTPVKAIARPAACSGFQHIKILRPVGPSRKDFVADLKERPGIQD